MGSEQIFKKSVLGGFKKEGVLNYVEQLQTEIIDLKKEISNKPDYSDEVKSLKSAKEDAVAETVKLTAKIDALKTENESLSEKNTLLVQELDECKKIIADYENKQKLFEEKISVIENKFAQLTNGYMIKDDSGAEYISKVNESVKNATSEISDVNEHIISACKNFENSSSALKSGIESLLNILSGISEELASFKKEN